MDDQDKSDAWKAGYTAGYQARVREETESYLASVLGGQQVYDRVIRDLINLKPFSERERDRLAVIREGHEAGIHEGGRIGCPWCEVRAAAEHECLIKDGRCLAPGHVETRDGRRAAWFAQGAAERGELPERHGESDRHHSGHYGVAAANPYEGRSLEDLGEIMQSEDYRNPGIALHASENGR